MTTAVEPEDGAPRITCVICGAPAAYAYDYGFGFIGMPDNARTVVTLPVGACKAHPNAGAEHFVTPALRAFVREKAKVYGMPEPDLNTESLERALIQ